MGSDLTNGGQAQRLVAFGRPRAERAFGRGVAWMTLQVSRIFLRSSVSPSGRMYLDELLTRTKSSSTPGLRPRTSKGQYGTNGLIRILSPEVPAD